MRRGSVLLLLTLAGGIARADDAPKPPAAPVAPAPAAKPAPPPTPEQAADAVLAAVKGKADAALKALAAQDAPDPWLVADELIRRAEFDVADAFARAAPRVDVEKLPAYVASRRGKPDDAARRSSLGVANAALVAGRHKDALKALGSVDPAPPADVPGVRRVFGRGLALAGLGRSDESAAALLVAADAAERVGWLARTSDALNQSGIRAYTGSDFRAALAAWERCLGVVERRGDRAGVAAALGNIGGAHIALGDYRTALEYQRRALRIMEDVGDLGGAAWTLGAIGNVHYYRGSYSEALDCYRRALKAQEDLGDRARAAATLVNIGNVHSALGNYLEALDCHERALRVLEDRGDRSGAALALGNIGGIHLEVGSGRMALEYYQRSLKMHEDLGDRAGAAMTLGNIGVAYSALGDYAKALATLERALVAQEGLGDREGVAGTLGNIGKIHDELGNFRKALEFEDRALTMFEDLGDRAGAARLLGNIGAAHAALGLYAKALEEQKRALSMKEDLGDRAGAALTLGSIGVVYHALADHAHALSTLERALAAQETLGDKAGATLTLVNIGVVYDSLGDYSKAIESLERAVAAAEKLEANGLRVGALQRAATVRLRSGDAGRAIADARDAVRLLKTLVGGLGEEQGPAARGRYAELFSTGLAAADRAGGASEAAFFLESGRAGTLLEALESRGALRATLLPEVLRVADLQARGREARALVAYQKSLDGGDLTAIRARDEELKAARAGVIDVVERIQREAKRAAQVVYPVAAKVGEIRGLLVAGDALVLYGIAEQDYDAYALVLTKDEARIVALGKSSEIVAACEALDPTDRDADPTAALGRLRDLVVKPLGLAKATKRLLVSPDGPLSYVPFAALVPDLVVAYESSGSTYGVLREEKDKHGDQVLAIADADYTAKFDPTALDVYAPIAAARAGAARGGRLAPLPGTREEATAVADVKLFGKDASESGLRAALAKKKDRWHSVHFACHGLVNPDRPTLSSLALTPVGEDDGFLTALEVLKMEIPSDLVVLSACETGKGKIVGGEGIVGLTRAFMCAGSPRVICSLWKVDDEATRALMTKFYELWNPKDGKPALPTAEALKQAQEFVKAQEQWKHPYYWAAWVLWGLPE